MCPEYEFSVSIVSEHPKSKQSENVKDLIRLPRNPHSMGHYRIGRTTETEDINATAFLERLQDGKTEKCSLLGR